MVRNLTGASVKVAIITKGSSDSQSVDILPTCKKIIITNLSNDGTSASSVVRVEASPLSDYAIVTKGGSTNATTTTRIANSFVVNPSNIYSIEKTGVAVGANAITITTKSTLASNLVGAPIRILYSDADPLSLELPDMMYISSISGTSVKINVDKVSTWAAASVNASGIEILSSKRLKKNVPAVISSVTVSGDTATIHGSFPSEEVMSEATVSIAPDSEFISPSYRGKGDSLRFVVKDFNESAGTFKVTGIKGKLSTMAAGTNVVACAIERATGFGMYFADSEAYYNSGMNMVSIAHAGIAQGDEVMIEQIVG